MYHAAPLALPALLCRFAVSRYVALSSALDEGIRVHWRRMYRVSVVGLLTIVIYVLSYAPAYRVVYRADSDVRGKDGVDWINPTANGMQLYRPVEWLIDHTPFRDVLMQWARLWDVGTQQSVDCQTRTTPSLWKYRK